MRGNIETVEAVQIKTDLAEVHGVVRVEPSRFAEFIDLRLHAKQANVTVATVQLSERAAKQLRDALTAWLEDPHYAGTVAR